MTNPTEEGAARREQILRFIQQYTDENGWPPSRREMAEHTGVTLTTVQFHIDKMVREGLLTRAPGVGRALRINGAAMKHGEVTA